MKKLISIVAIVVFALSLTIAVNSCKKEEVTTTTVVEVITDVSADVSADASADAQ